IGSYIGLLLLGAAFTSIGIFASALTDNQIISFLMAVFFSFLMYQFFFLLGSLFDANPLIYFLEQLGMEYHYTSLRKGLIDSRDLVYFLSLIALMLISTKLVLGSRKW
ncbi:MAG: gliding motility-associated ABC transporter permease subunit GldF, partial [Bacteroidota bacterium]